MVAAHSRNNTQASVAHDTVTGVPGGISPAPKPEPSGWVTCNAAPLASRTT